MRRFAAVLALVMCLLLVGCRAGREADRRFLVSALGFDADGSVLTVSAETLIVNSESTGEDISKKLFTATGSNARDCIFRLVQGMSKDIQLAHCGVIAVGDTVTGAALDGVIEYCSENREINLSSYVVATANAGELLSGKAVSALTVGYELMGFMEHAADQTGIMYGSRLYEVQAARLKKTPVYLLPRFSAAQDSYTLDGTSVIIGNRNIMELSPEETSVYSLVTGTNDGGKINIDTNIYNVKSPYTRFECDAGGGKADIKLEIIISPDGADRALCDYVEGCADSIAQRAQGADVFGFADRIYAENDRLWKKIKDDTASAISGAEISISCEMRRAEHAK